MELVKGETRGQRLRQLGGSMSVGDVLRLGLQIADSLAAARAKNIVHRDLKPDRVAIGRQRASNELQGCEVVAY